MIMDKEAFLYRMCQQVYPSANEGFQAITNIQGILASIANQGQRMDVETYLLTNIAKIKEQWAEMDKKRIQHSCRVCKAECDCVAKCCDKEECTDCFCAGCSNCQKIKHELDKRPDL